MLTHKVLYAMTIEFLTIVAIVIDCPVLFLDSLKLLTCLKQMSACLSVACLSENSHISFCDVKLF